jgi:cell division transport system permease protein
MIAQMFGRGPLDGAVPGDPAGLFLGSMIALIGYLAAIGGFGLVLLGDDLREWNRSLGNAMTLQLPPETSAPRIEMSLALLRQTPGITGVRLLEPAETARLLEPWLGSAALTSTLPVPRLVDMQLEPAAAVDLAGLRQKLASIAPGAQLDDYRSTIATRRRAATRLASLIAIGIAALAGLAALLTTGLTRARFAAHRRAFELLHRIGATDDEIARPVQSEALRHGLVGGAIGAAAALMTLLVLGNLMTSRVSLGIADWRPWGVVVAVTLVTGFGVMSAARLAVLRRLARLP